MSFKVLIQISFIIFLLYFIFSALKAYLGYVPDKSYGTFRRKSSSSEKVELELSHDHDRASDSDEEVTDLLQ